MTCNDFDAFFRALHGYGPFAWQSRLAREVAAQGRWPQVLSLPTSAGKTACIDIAVFMLSLEAEMERRTAPLRTFFVIDRRIVVDEAARRAEGIAGKLREAVNGPAGVLREVARRLLSLGGDVPIHASRLRGGMYREGSWAKSPVQSTVCVSTVDQVGSRLLFRGYGVSEYQRAIHAGLVGNDSLIILDEAHLSEPFLQTLQAVNRFRGERWTQRPVVTPFQVVCMSATPKGGVDAFCLKPEEREDSGLRPRLEAGKPARLVEVAADSDDESQNQVAFVERVVQEALALAGLANPEVPVKGRKTHSANETIAPAGVVGVVVNRVASARMIFDSLRSDLRRCHAILLTGRIRPFDRDELLYRTDVDEGRGWFRFMEAAKDRPRLDLPLFVVATQTVEVGANLSFDALVTEAAPLDALRQRFGRLDRLGVRGLSDAAIIARKDAIAAGADDPVYGKAIATTWKWLGQQAHRGKPKIVDFGVNALKVPEDAETLASLSSPRSDAPVMLPAHIDTLVQTSPTPAPDLDVSLYLHGPASGPADVQIVWRADLPVELRKEDEEDCISTVALVPPTSMEALSVPPWSVRAWLTRNRLADDISDVEGAPPALGSAEKKAKLRSFLRWRGLDDSELVGPEDDDDPQKRLRPGDTIIVPAGYGGTDQFGWNPNHDGPVRDVADACSLFARQLPVLRLQSNVLAGWNAHLAEDVCQALSGLEAEDVAGEQAGLDLIRRCPDSPAWMKEAADWLSVETRRRPPVEYPEVNGPGIAVVARRRMDRPTFSSSTDRQAEPDQDDFTTDDDTASLTGGVSLDRHCRDVKELAEKFAQQVGLTPDLVHDIGVVGGFHDVGKADVRFQAWLYGGDLITAQAATELLAKSDMNPRNRAAIRWARERAGYPAGGRHEFLSVALLCASDQALKGSNDPDLVLHLVGTHHGRGRAFVPVVEDAEPVNVRLQHGDFTLEARSQHGQERLDSGWVDRFWLMNRRYGYWGLALLEAILQLADHRCSEQVENHRDSNRLDRTSR
jgi:CRISPR-associated endonuclease/helicase Cas3